MIFQIDFPSSSFFLMKSHPVYLEQGHPFFLQFGFFLEDESVQQSFLDVCAGALEVDDEGVRREMSWYNVWLHRGVQEQAETWITLHFMIFHLKQNK